MQQHDTSKKVASYNDMLIGSRNAVRRDEHCFEIIAEENGVTWVNHSMATSVETTWHALRDTPGPIVLIIGGIDRGNDYSVLVPAVHQKVKKIVCLGSTRERFFEAFQRSTGMVVHAADLREAVQIAAIGTGPGDTVLFAPSCPSYHAFDNYKNRGNEFRSLVREILPQSNAQQELK